MKRINYRLNKDNAGLPFWKPWGIGGYLWRFLLFLLLLFILFVLLSMFRSCEGNNNNALKSVPRDIYPPVDPGKKPELIDPANPPGKGSNNPGAISDPGPYLPDSTENIIPPIDPGDIITDPGNKTKIVNDMINVIIKSDNFDPKELEKAVKDFAAQFKQAYPDSKYEIAWFNIKSGLLKIKVPESERERVQKELPSKISGIDFKVFSDIIFSQSGFVPSDKGFSNVDLSWYFAPIQAYDAWDITQGSPEIIVAIVDSYFDLEHAELDSSRLVSPYSIRFASSDVRPASDCPRTGMLGATFYHGTSVAVQAVGESDNAVGLCGIAPKCKFMPISMGHEFTIMTIMEGVLYAINQGADVINISAGTCFDENEILMIPVEEQVRMSEQMGLEIEDVWSYIFDIADRKNVTIVWSAGNNKCFSGLDTSKRNPKTIRVAAVNQNLQRADFSNFGNVESMQCYESTISAPGTEILCASPFNSYVNNLADCRGTSYSSPIVAGAVALMKSVDSTLTNSRIIEILKETGKPLNGSPEIGPLLQMKDALLKVKGDTATSASLQLLMGTWRSDGFRDKSSNGKVTPSVTRVFFMSENGKNGTLKLYEEGSTELVYSADVSIKYVNDEIILTQLENARSSGSSSYYGKYIFTCKFVGNDKLLCFHTGDNVKSEQYYVSKISNNSK